MYHRDNLVLSFKSSLHHRDLHSFPTRRSSDLVSEATVRARYGRLTAEGILQVVAVTNPLGLGYEQALVGVKTSGDRKSTRLNSSHTVISYAVFCLKKNN